MSNDKDTKDLTLSVFIDLSKAFDTINPEILLHKLENLGVRGIANSWFRSYLTGRKQFLNLYDVKSTMEDMQCGVPQGSILGPILFLIYVNDIRNATTLNVFSFADDTTIITSSPDIKELYAKMNFELQKLEVWFMANKLCLNVKKTKYILFRPNVMVPKSNTNCIMLNGQKVVQIGHKLNEKSFKFLGIHIDETLSWKYQIKSVCSRIANSNYMINKVKHVLPKSTLFTLYSALVHSHINYGLLIWGSSPLITKIMKMQKRCIRIINAKSYNYHTEPLFKTCKILKIEDQYKYNVLSFMFLLKNNGLPESFKFLRNLYFNQQGRRNTRQYNYATLTGFRTVYTSLLPLHRYPRIWNNIDEETKSVHPLTKFRKNIHAKLLECYTNIVCCANNRCIQCFPL